MWCGKRNHQIFLVVYAMAFGAIANGQNLTDGNSIGQSLSGESLRSGGLRLSIQGQSSSDQTREDLQSYEQSKRTRASMQAELGLHSHIQGMIQVQGDNDKDLETPESSLDGQRTFNYRGTTLGAKIRLLDTNYFKAAILPYGVHTQAFTPEELEESSARWEGGWRMATGVGHTDYLFMNLFGGIHYRDSTAYRTLQHGNLYHAGVSLETRFSKLVQLGAHYRLEGQRFAPLPRDVEPGQVLDVEDRTLTSRVFGGGIKVNFADASLIAFGERSLSGNEQTSPNANTLGLRFSYEFGQGTQAPLGRPSQDTIIGDDKNMKKDAGDSTANSTSPAGEYDEMKAEIDFSKDLGNGSSAPGTVDFDKELAEGAKTQVETVNAYEQELEAIRQAELQAEKAKAAEETANAKKRSEELNQSYQAAKQDRSKVRKQLQDEGLEITAEDANWTGLED